MVIQGDVIALLRRVVLGEDIRRPGIISGRVQEGSGWSVEQRYVSMKIN
jgi:hypothetical protein